MSKADDQKNFREWHRTKVTYTKMTDNHPTIHSNRFPAWEELSEAAQQEMIKKYNTEGKL